MEESLIFGVSYRSPDGFLTERFERLEYDTVELLKIDIHKAFGVPLHKQIIKGWKNEPENDHTLLLVCSSRDLINYLVVSCRLDDSDTKFSSKDPMEIQAVKSCIRKINVHITISRIKFNIEKLSQAKDKLFAPAQERRFILLYIHNSEEDFSKTFLQKLRNEEICDILNNYFYVIGWDVENETYHPALCSALKDAGFEHMSAIIESKACAAIIIQNVNEKPTTTSFLMGDEVNSTEDSFLLCLKNSRDYLKVNLMLANGLDASQNDVMTSEIFQKVMADRLGDRAYDRFAFDQHKSLKKKIGYALFGQPVEEEKEENNGYNKVQNKDIENLYKRILSQSNMYAEYKDEVEISFIYNVLEPTQNERESRARKHAGYNPDADISPVPIFVLRKCRETHGEACRIFIDHVGRVYSNWEGYLENNKVPKSVMVVPKNGRYQVKNETVLLERHVSPSCRVLHSVLRVGDISSTVAGLGSGGVMLTAALPGIAVMPPVLIGAAAVGAAAGVYSVTRSAFGLADKIKHYEDLSFTNSEARGIYINIIAGSMGFVGAGANVAVSQLISRGFKIGQGVGFAVNAIGVANIGISGFGIINSSYDIFDQWINNNQTPSALTILQLTSSILFFGNAVYNFRTVGQIVDETQAKVLEDFHDSLRSNRHRKTFNKLLKETIRQNDGNPIQGRAEVIKTIRNIPNKDDVFAALTRNNKLMNKNGLRFSAAAGKITIDGQTIDMNKFISMNNEQASAFMSNFSSETSISVNDTNSMINHFSLNNWSLPDVNSFAKFASILINKFEFSIQQMIMQLVKWGITVLTKYFGDIITDTLGKSANEQIMYALMKYLSGRAAELLQKFFRWLRTGSPHYYEPYYTEMPVDTLQRNLWIFEKIVTIYFNGGEDALKNMKNYLGGWLISRVSNKQLEDEANRSKQLHSPRSSTSILCTICGGRYFKNNK